MGAGGAEVLGLSFISLLLPLEFVPPCAWNYRSFRSPPFRGPRSATILGRNLSPPAGPRLRPPPPRPPLRDHPRPQPQPASRTPLPRPWPVATASCAAGASSSEYVSATATRRQPPPPAPRAPPAPPRR